VLQDHFKDAFDRALARRHSSPPPASSGSPPVHPCGDRSGLARAPRTLYERPYRPAEPCEIYSRLITIEWPCPRAHASGAVPASSESASAIGAMSLSTFIIRASSSARPIRSLVKPQEARRQSHRQSRLRPNRVRNGLPAGGTRIRTCMGLFLSSNSFWFVVGSLFGTGKPFFVPSPAIRFAERAEGVKGPKR